MGLNLLAMPDARGVVTTFDESSGLGIITADNGSEIPFHCTTISDGTREIEVGRRVYVRIFAATKGRVEAMVVEKL